jgi:hypothetical protein
VKRGGSLSFLTIFSFAVPELLDLIGHGETSIPPYNFVVGGITTFIERERVLVIRLITNIVVSLLNLYINTLQIKRYINRILRHI